ncbi:MAG: IPT/TIG domain-containing protein [Planctomycetota bacterium]|nr:IPT/TIG domain-containing protein [Planctomycetota bacterium]
MHHLPAISTVLMLAAFVPGQSFSYPNFSNTAGINMLGSAVRVGSAVRLTTVAQAQTGIFWNRVAMPVANGFDTSFTFRITPPPTGTIAEGMAFIIHDDPNGIATQGGTVWGMGYGSGANNSPGIRNCLAFEIDTYLDPFLGDTSANEVTIHTRGPLGCNENESFSIGRTTPSTDLSNSQVHTMRIVYTPGTLQVFIDNQPNPIIQVPYDLATGGTYLTGAFAPPPNLSNGTMFGGFSATTGASGLWETVEILSWDWTSTPLTDPCYQGTLGEDVLTIDGNPGDFRREVGLLTFQSFDIELSVPAGAPTGAPFILLMAPSATPGSFGTSTPIGDACMPILPLGLGVSAVADSFGILPALLPSTPAPFTLQIPAGLITVPISVTLQAVLSDPGSPLGLGLTNAIDVIVDPMPAPAISLVAPASGAAGAPITITGTGFGPGVAVTVAGVPVPVTSSSPTQVVFPYPANVACDAPLVVQNLNGLSASGALNPTPNVTGTLLGSGPATGGSTFIIQGSGFASGTTVTIGGAAATVLSSVGSTVVVSTPPGSPGSATVVITTPGGCSATTNYNYL